MKQLVLRVIPEHKDNRLVYQARIKPGNPVTVCEVEYQCEPIIDQTGYWTMAAYGLSVCSPQDGYNRETGMRLALASALRKTGDKTLRGAFWRAYLEKHPVSTRAEPERVIYRRETNIPIPF